MSDGRHPLERLLDLVIYAPLGLVLKARDELPELAAQGRQKVSADAGLARMVGQMAVAQGRRRAGSLLSGPRPASKGASEPAAKEPARKPGRPVVVRELAGEGGRYPVVAPEVLPEPGREGDVLAMPGADPVAARDASATADPATMPSAADLPIPGYDSLSASQVVQRLPGLSPAELEAVRTYEAAGRARKTVLLRVAQLRAAG